jgi:hypothetical protein
MKYVIRGQHRNMRDLHPQDLDVCDDLEAAEKEAYRFRIEHPSWMFWIAVKEDENEEIQKSICAEPQSEVRP